MLEHTSAQMQHGCRSNRGWHIESLPRASGLGVGLWVYSAGVGGWVAYRVPTERIETTSLYITVSSFTQGLQT